MLTGVEPTRNAMIVSPWGEVLGRLSTEPGFVAADLNLAELWAVRDRFPTLSHRRLTEETRTEPRP